MERKITLSPIKTQCTYYDLANSLISAWEENNPTGTTFRIESPYITVLTLPASGKAHEFIRGMKASECT